MADAEKLTIKDAESAQKAILALILKYPDFPKSFKADNTTVKWNNINDGMSIGIFPLQGAVYLKKYISGSYTAQMPFQIVYRSSPTNNKTSIDAQTVVESLGAWLEESGIEFKDSNMTLENISRTSPVFSSGQNEGKTDYAVNMQLKYVNKK